MLGECGQSFKWATESWSGVTHKTKEDYQRLAKNMYLKALKLDPDCPYNNVSIMVNACAIQWQQPTAEWRSGYKPKKKKVTSLSSQG
jgi:hypothetical protein